MSPKSFGIVRSAISGCARSIVLVRLRLSRAENAERRIHDGQLEQEDRATVWV
jgi:hypothetical protein